MKKLVAFCLLGAALGSGAVVFAKDKPPVVDVSKKRHPNLEAAQKLSLEAFEKLTAAQKANEYDMDGHAEKAKGLLEQVNNEIKLAAEAANKH